MKPISKRISEAFQDELIEGTIYRIDMDRVDVVPFGSTGVMQSLPLTGDRDKIQIGDTVRVVRVGGERVALMGDVALGFDIEEEVTEPVGGVTPNELEDVLTNRPQADSNAVLHDGAGRVGINRAPDPQFDLDVAGNIRAGGYIVGRHALQVTGAKMICHYDGPEPYDTNTKGELNGHMGQIGEIVGTYEFRAGKFGKALCMSLDAILRYQADTAIDITKPGTLSFWRKHEAAFPLMGDGGWLQVLGNDEADVFRLGNSTDSLFLEVKMGAIGVVPYMISYELPTDNEFHHYAVTWTETNLTLYVDGARYTTEEPLTFALPATNPQFLDIFTEMHTVDDLVTLDYAMSADEIKAIFESNAPVFAETSAWGFKSASTLAYADSEGLWALSSAGNAAFGVSGVDFKYWGDHFLDSGDVLIGNGENYVKWDDSSATLIIAGDGRGMTEINGSNITTGTISSERIALDGFLTIGALGGIYQGTGSAASPGTGLKLFNSGGIGKLETYKLGVSQVTIDTDGALKAGGEVIKLDQEGVDIKLPATVTAGSENKYAYKFMRGAVSVGGLYGYSDANVNKMDLVLWPDAIKPSHMTIAVGTSQFPTDHSITLTAGCDPYDTNFKLIATEDLNQVYTDTQMLCGDTLEVTSHFFSRSHAFKISAFSGQGDYGAEIVNDTNYKALTIWGSNQASTYRKVKVYDDLYVNRDLNVKERIIPEYGSYVAMAGSVNGGAQIVNDNSANASYQALMILGSNFATGGTGTRKVKLWDRLEINGSLQVSSASTFIGSATFNSYAAFQTGASAAVAVYIGDHGYTAGTGYGIKILDQTSGTGNYALYTGAGSVRFGDTVTHASHAVTTGTSYMDGETVKKDGDAVRRTVGMFVPTAAQGVTGFGNAAYKSQGGLIDLDVACTNVPASIKAVLVRIKVQDTGGNGLYYVALGDGAGGVQLVAPCWGGNQVNYVEGIVNCSGGNIYYTVVASGGASTATLTTTLTVYGYWI